MSRSTPRRPSRTTTSRPRKIAGRDDTVADAGAETTAPDTDATLPSAPKKPEPVELTKPIEPAKPAPPAPSAKPVVPPDGPSGRTSTLLAVVGILVLLLVLQCGWFIWSAVRDEAVSSTPSSTEDKSDGPIAVPPGRPVVLNEVSVQGGVEAAAAAAQVMFARNWKTYDEGVDDAVALMTEDFGAEFKTTAEDVKAEFVRKKTEVQVRVVAQSVVRANETTLEALIFLNQYVFRGEGKDGTSTYTPYRALMTMVHTDTGWLVDGVDTK
ncbi:hypothetical protein F0U44_18830 [Nocardioides humilatus]|uniref:Mce-associated membrane protein n=1 Tax=Nocardioides humilatus TaxID=2607660 RepID=A0A5B1L7H2_9ACTN|nr:hypothetical protein [Nocardioides humilatus]KAA1416376.1 hypothetical protein F0U44_18830 [Nocardioides humilatus]